MLSLVIGPSFMSTPTQSRVKCLTDRSFKVFNSWNFFQNDIENINPILLKCISTILNRCKVMKKYINYTFSSNQNQLRDKSDVHLFKLPYIGSLLTVSKINFRNFAKSFVNKILILSLFLVHSKFKTLFFI